MLSLFTGYFAENTQIRIGYNSSSTGDRSGFRDNAICIAQTTEPTNTMHMTVADYRLV